jgi:hypothetical protein
VEAVAGSVGADTAAVEAVAGSVAANTVRAEPLWAVPRAAKPAFADDAGSRLARPRIAAHWGHRGRRTSRTVGVS